MPGWGPIKKPEPKEEVEVLVEVEKELGWRCEQLEKAGFDRSVAFRLAVNGADWHQAADMLAQGCPPKQILAILT